MVSSITAPHIVLVGVWGTWMSGVAHLLLDLGYVNLVGIDRTESELTRKLAAKGMQIIIGHGHYQGHPQDIVLYSSAASNSPEVEFARAHRQDDHKHPGLVLNYFEFLGELSKYFITVAVAGTHGKSTTTGLTAQALAEHHPDFGLSILGAGVVQRWWENARFSSQHTEAIRRLIDHSLGSHRTDRYQDTKKYLFVVEACEYNRHFLNLDVDYALITNIELDHADVYGTFENYFDAFLSFSKKVKKHIYMIAWAIGQQLLFSPEQNPDIWDAWTKYISVSSHTFNFSHLLGSHNHGNASLAEAICLTLLQDAHSDTTTTPQELNTTLSSFQGLWRRWELLGIAKNGACVLTDYGHHPTELASTLSGIREKYSDKRLICIFQPHQARRVMEFWDAFISALHSCDQVYIYDIYAAREQLEELKALFTQHHFQDISSFEMLGQKFAEAAHGTYTNQFSDISHILDTAGTEDIIVVFTAWDLDYQLRTQYKFA